MKNNLKKIPSYVGVPVLSLLLIWGLVFVFWSYEKTDQAEQLRSIFKAKSANASQFFQNQVSSYDGLFLSARGFFAGTPQIGESNLSHWADAQQLFQKYPEIYAISVLAPMSTQEYAQFRKVNGLAPAQSVTPYAIALFHLDRPSQSPSPFAAPLMPGEDGGNFPPLREALQRTEKGGGVDFFNMAKNSEGQSASMWSGWVVPIYKNEGEVPGVKSPHLLAWMVISIDWARGFQRSISPLGSLLHLQIKAPPNYAFVIEIGAPGEARGLHASFDGSGVGPVWKMEVSPSQSFWLDQESSQHASDWVALLGGVLGPVIALLLWSLLRPAKIVALPQGPEIPDEILRLPLFNPDGDSNFDLESQRGKFLVEQMLSAAQMNIHSIIRDSKAERWDRLEQQNKKITETSMALSAPRLLLASHHLDRVLSESRVQNQWGIKKIQPLAEIILRVVKEMQAFLAASAPKH